MAMCPFEVHLPQLVGFGTLKAHIGCVLGTLRFIDQPMAPENGSDRALGRHARIATIVQHPGQHMRPLGRVRLAQRYDAFLHLPARLLRAGVRALGQVVQTVLSALPVTPQPLVAGLRLIPIRRHNSLMFTPSDCARAIYSLRKDICVPTFHGMVILHLQILHALWCNLCLRTCVTYVPSLYTLTPGGCLIILVRGTVNWVRDPVRWRVV